MALVIVLTCSAAVVSPPSAHAVALHSAVAAMEVSDEASDWADALTAPRTYLRDARRAVANGHYAVAARKLRNAAAMVSHHERYAVGRERTRLQIAVKALRLTAKDVAAGAVTSAAQLDGVLNDTHRDLWARSGLSP